MTTNYLWFLQLHCLVLVHSRYSIVCQNFITHIIFWILPKISILLVALYCMVIPSQESARNVAKDRRKLWPVVKF